LQKPRGINRNAGTHAAGVVISNEPLWERLHYLNQQAKIQLATQYSGKYIEDVDLISLTFLA